MDKVPETCICCQEAPATIFCENCNMALCTENKCSANLHLFPESMQQHKQRPINGAASAAATAQARDRLSQLLASLQASAADEERQKKAKEGTAGTAAAATTTAAAAAAPTAAAAANAPAPK